MWDHADLDEVRRELRAQVERAILWGFDVSHLDSHMGTLQLRPEFFDVYLDLAVEFEGAGRSPFGQDIFGFHASTEIDREEFGLTWNVALETGGVLVGKKIQIEIEGEAVRQA